MDAAPDGLGEADALERLKRFGPNRLVARERRARLRELLSLLGDPMALMLLAAAGAHFLLGQIRDGAVLLAALVPVLGVDVLLAARARRALRQLAQVLAPRARVRRAGLERDVPIEALVPGDALCILEGDLLPADGVVQSAVHLSVDESHLTGEAEPQAKPPGAPFFAGSRVLAGHGWGEIESTGARTRFGEIARLLAETPQPPTPLQQKAQRLVRALGGVALLVAMAVLGLGLWRGQTFGEAVLSALSLAMAAVPEEFPLVLTLFLSLGTWRLAKSGVLVKRLAQVETLGSTTVICVDKTGTLTAGRFELGQIVPLLRGAGESSVLEAAVLASEVAPHDPLERAIQLRCGEALPALLARWTPVRDHPFDPALRMTSHVWRGEAGQRAVVKGAPETVFARCALSPEARVSAEAAQARLARSGARVLAVAEREVLPGDPATRASDESALRLVGLIGFIDPLRPEVPAAVRECRAAGIAVKMITGDHALTASSIAEAAGLERPHSVVLGADLGALGGRVREASVFARIRPEQKHAIVEALSQAGEIVAMTGDGINDAPALRRADIGVSLGIRGTDVARAAADVVLLRDDFSALVATVREGRRIFANLQRAFLFLVSFHAPVIALAVLAPVIGVPLVLLPVHLVWLELIVHPVSALVFEAEPAPADAMARPPRDPRAPLLPGPLLARSIVTGLLIAAAAIFIDLRWLPLGADVARSGALVVVLAGALALVFAERSLSGSFLTAGLPRTARFWTVWGAVAASLPLAFAVPPLTALLHLGQLTPRQWMAALAAGVASVAWRAVPDLRARRARPADESGRPASRSWRGGAGVVARALPRADAQRPGAARRKV